MLGHDVCHCAGYFAASKKWGGVVYKYGYWLKSTGAHSCSPPKRGQARSSPIDEVAEAEHVRNSRQQPPTADGGVIVIPKDHESSNNGSNGELGPVRISRKLIMHRGGERTC